MKLAKCFYTNKPPAIATVFKIKGEEKWKWINLTKEHICPCIFSSEKEAWEDLKKEVKEGKVEHYEIIHENFKFDEN